MLRVGDRAPDFRGPDQHGRDIALGTLLKQGPVVVFFTSHDLAPVLTRELCALRDMYTRLHHAGATEVIGISLATPADVVARAAAYGLNFPLLSDSNRSISRAYGVLRLFGVLSQRASVVIDTAAVVQGVFHRELRLRRQLQQVHRRLQQLSAATPPG